jgi:hypothetical protein
MERRGRNIEAEVFKRMMRLIPESSVRAIELQVILLRYDAELQREAEANLALQEEPLTEETLNAEMARIDRENAHAVAQNVQQLMKECECAPVQVVPAKRSKSWRVKQG